MIINKLGKDTLIYGGSDFIIKLVAFAAFPFVAAALTPSGYGVLELVITLVGLCGLIMGCGLNNAVQRFYWDNDMDGDQRAQLVSTGFILQFIFWLMLATILGVAYFIYVFYFPDQIEIEKFGLTTAAIISAIFLVYTRQAGRYIQDTIRLHFKPFRFFVFAFLSQGLTAIVAMLVLVLFSGGIEGFLITLSLMSFIALPVGLFLIRKDLNLKFNKNIALEIIGYGYPFIFAGLAYWLFSSMDRWMLSTLSSVEETGIYAVAFRFVSIIFLVSTAFGQAWSPYAVKIRTDYPEQYKQIYANIFLLLVFIMLALGGGLALFSGEIIGLIMPKDYYQAAIPLAILSFAIILQSTQQVTAIGISLMKKTKLLATIAWLSALINFVGNYFLIPTMGASGAAIATLMSYGFITFSYLFFTQRLFPLPLEWRKLGFLIIVSLLVAAISIVYNNINFVWNMIIAKILFAAILLFIGVWVINIKKTLKISI